MGHESQHARRRLNSMVPQLAVAGLVCVFAVFAVSSGPASAQARGIVHDYAYTFSADTQRPRSDYGRYGNENVRHILGFIGAQPGMEILELSPKDGFYTELLSVIAGDTGHVVARNTAPLHRKYEGDLTARGLLDRLTNVTYEVRPHDRAWRQRWADRVTWLDVDASVLADARRTRGQVEALFQKISLVLAPDGYFIAIIRDPRGIERREETRRQRIVELAGENGLSLVASEVHHYPAETGEWTDVLLKFELKD